MATFLLLVVKFFFKMHSVQVHDNSRTIPECDLIPTPHPHCFDRNRQFKKNI